MKKDHRVILILFGIELIMLLILSAVASAKLPSSNSRMPEESPEADLFEKKMLFEDSLYFNYFTLKNAEAETEEKAEYVYYAFRLSEAGVTVVRSEEDIPSGLVDTSLPVRALTIPASKGDLWFGPVYIQNDYVPEKLDLREIFAAPLKLRCLSSMSETSVVLYHTHTSEGYCRDEADQFDLKRYATTSDTTLNVVANAIAMRSVLAESGIRAINDTTVHDSGKDSLISYDLGKKTLTGLLQQNPATQLVVDIHRDGVDPVNGKRYGPTAEKDGKVYAKLMFVVGMDYDSNKVRATANNPFWEDNFKLALLLCQKMEEKIPGITRGISLRKTPYNQNMAQNTLLIEVGFDGNLISEAQNTAKALAEVLCEVYS